MTPQLSRMLPVLQAVADAADGSHHWTQITHGAAVCSSAGAERAHHGQRHEWADRGQALSAQPPPRLWLHWPEPLRAFVYAVRELCPFTPACIAKVREYCAGDFDLELNVSWMEDGVPLADFTAMPPHAHCRNSPTTREDQNGAGLRATLQKDVAAGRYLPLPRGWESWWVHALAAVLKANGSIREIHNHKHRGNDYMSYTRTRVWVLDDICASFKEGMVFAVLDLSVYYRHWMVRPEDMLLQVFQFAVYDGEEGLWLDPFMEFGSRNSPEIANRAAAMFCRAFRRWLDSHGYAELAFVVVNTDDWLLGAMRDVADQLFAALQKFLLDMGLGVNAVKSKPPEEEAQYTGWIFDAVQMSVRLTPSKLRKALLGVEAAASATGAISLHDWESLYGFLQHVCTVVPWGTVWLQGICACMVVARRVGSARRTTAVDEELAWWTANAAALDGHRRFMGPRRPQPNEDLSISTDATGRGGIGIFVHGQALRVLPAVSVAYFAETFDSAAAVERGDAQAWELAALVMLVERFGPWLLQQGARAVVWWTDSTSAMAGVNRMAHRHRDCLLLLRRLYSSLRALDMVIEARHIAGVDNTLPDCLSRWDEPGKPAAFWQAAAAWSASHADVPVRIQEW